MDEFLAVLLRVRTSSNVVFDDGTMAYNVQQISPEIISGRVTVPFRTFSYGLGSFNGANSTGIITD